MTNRCRNHRLIEIPVGKQTEIGDGTSVESHSVRNIFWIILNERYVL